MIDENHMLQTHHNVDFIISHCSEKVTVKMSCISVPALLSFVFANSGQLMNVNKIDSEYCSL